MEPFEVDCVKFLRLILFDAVKDPVSGRVARIVTELPGKLEDAVPVIRVVRTGGPDDGIILDIPTVVLHAFVAQPDAGTRLLQAARTTLRKAVGRVVAIDGGKATMPRLRVLGGPAWAAYENPALRHAFMTIQPRIKITR